MKIGDPKIFAFHLPTWNQTQGKARGLSLEQTEPQTDGCGLAISDNEILFRRPDFCPAWHSWVRSLRLPPLGRLRPAARDRPRAECRRGSAAQGPKIRSRIDSRSLWTENSPGSLRSPQLRVGRRGRVSSQRRFRFESGHVGAAAPIFSSGVGHRKQDLTGPMRRARQKRPRQSAPNPSMIETDNTLYQIQRVG